MQATRIATTNTEHGKVSYWMHSENVYRLNEYEPVQYDVYGVPLGARWECSKAHFDAWRKVLIPGEETSLDRALEGAA